MYIFFVLIALVILASFFSVHVPVMMGFATAAVLVLAIGYFQYRRSLPKKPKKLGQMHV